MSFVPLENIVAEAAITQGMRTSTRLTTFGSRDRGDLRLGAASPDRVLELPAPKPEQLARHERRLDLVRSKCIARMNHVGQNVAAPREDLVARDDRRHELLPRSPG